MDPIDISLPFIIVFVIGLTVLACIIFSIIRTNYVQILD